QDHHIVVIRAIVDTPDPGRIGRTRIGEARQAADGQQQHESNENREPAGAHGDEHGPMVSEQSPPAYGGKVPVLCIQGVVEYWLPLPGPYHRPCCTLYWNPTDVKGTRMLSKRMWSP